MVHRRVIRVVTTRHKVATNYRRFGRTTAWTRGKGVGHPTARIVGDSRTFLAKVRPMNSDHDNQFIGWTRGVRPHRAHHIFNTLALNVIGMHQGNSGCAVRLTYRNFDYPHHRYFRSIHEGTRQIRRPHHHFGRQRTIFTNLRLVERVQVTLLSVDRQTSRRTFGEAGNINNVGHYIDAHIVARQVPLLLVIGGE